MLSLPMEKPLPSIQSGEIRIITPDWSSAETLITLGAPLVGVAEKPSYNVWVDLPPIPDNIIDMGLRAQPSYELVTALQPTLLINSTFLQQFLPSIFSSIPTKEVNFNTAKGGSWDQILSSTRELGQLSGRESQATALVSQTNALLAERRQMLSSMQNRPIAMVQFIDARSVRIFGDNSLYGIVLNKLGLHNAWDKTASVWGFDTVPLTELAHLPKETMLLVIKPHPVTIHNQLLHSAIWQHLAVSEANNHRVLPSTWLFGGLPAVEHFSATVVDALVNNQQVSW